MRSNHMVPGFLRFALAICCILHGVSCKKNEIQLPGPHPEMDYLDLANKEIRPGNPAYFVDINKDGHKDLLFSTMLVADPVRRADKLQFFVMSDIETRLPVNQNEQMPAMVKGDSIVLRNFNGYEWFELTSIIFVQKVTTITDVTWEGTWQNATRKYMAFQIKKDGRIYNGWLELSIDIVDAKLVLHKAAISKLPEKDIKAGY